MNIDVKALREFYFEAMLEMFLGDAPRVDVPEKPGYRRIEYRRDEYRMVDEYLKTLGTSSHSSGQAVIWQGDTAVWTMAITGRFEREALPVIKKALRKAFTARQFIGGRGPQHFNDGRYSYENHFELWDFKEFNGRESVYQHGQFENKRWLGSQMYQGRILVPYS